MTFTWEMICNSIGTASAKSSVDISLGTSTALVAEE